MGKIVTLDSLRRSGIGPELYQKVKSDSPLKSSAIKILIAIPTPGPMVYFDTMLSTMRMIYHLLSIRREDGGGKYSPMIANQRATNIHTGSNKVCEKAIESGAEYILMLDSDMTFPHTALEQLLALDKDIVSALAVRRVYPYTPVMTMKRNPDSLLSNLDMVALDTIETWTDGELLKVDAVGTAFMLIKTSVFKKLKKPYFHYPWFEGFDCDLSCDNYFCLKAGEAGFDIFVDTSLKIGHIGEYNASIDDYHACRAVPAKVKEAKSA